MKQKNARFGLISLLLVVISSSGCRPSAREVASVISTIPVGTSREEIRKILNENYSKKYPNQKQSYALDDPPKAASTDLINANKALLSGSRKRGEYAFVYPPELFGQTNQIAFCDFVGLVAEAAHGNGSLSLYYDRKTNYLGFFATSSERDRR